jgi:ABC-type lipoprotein export system ATPase subunit
MTVALDEVFVIRRAPHGDVAALRGLNLRAARGEMLAVLGPSGAGKSTLLAACAGQLRPSSGRLEVCGVDVSAASQRALDALRREHLGIVRQHYHRSLPRELTAAEIVALPLRLGGGGAREGRRRAAVLLEHAGLAGHADALPDELSGGQQQRVAICAALATGPRLVLADEPTGELDAAASRDAVDLLASLARDEQATVLVVTHDQHVADRADRTVHLRDGRLSAEGAREPVLVVDDHGWIRLPGPLREEAGLGARVRARAGHGHVRLEAVDQPRGPEPAAPAQVAEHRSERVEPMPVVVDAVSKRFGLEVVLDGVSATFAPGRLHAIAGPSGSGKTTLLHVIGGLLAPDAGTVRLGDTAIGALDTDAAADWRARHLGYLSQHSTLAGFLSVAENVGLGLRIRGCGGDVAGALARVGIGSLSSRSGDLLSGGEQRRTALARALVGSPSVLLLDEPTAHLDRESGRAVIDVVAAAAHGRGMTVIACSHDRDLLESADSVLALDA